MSVLLTLNKISIAFGNEELLSDASLTLESGERVCLIGRNGAGKSTLLKIIEGRQLPDSGTLYRDPNLKIARLSQELPYNLDMTVFEYVAEGLQEQGKLLTQYHH